MDAAVVEEAVVAVLMWFREGIEDCEIAAAVIANRDCRLLSWRRYWENVEHVERRILGGIETVNVCKKGAARYLSTPPSFSALQNIN